MKEQEYIFNEKTGGFEKAPEEMQVQAGVIMQTAEELEIFRQWFNCIYDTHPSYLSKKDYQLVTKLYKTLNLDMPKDISSLSV